MIRLALLGLVLLLASGCWRTQTRTTYQATGTIDGKAVSLTVDGAGASDAGVDPLAAIQGAVAALRGDLAGVSAAIAAQPPPAPPAVIAQAVVEATPKSSPPPPPATVTGSAIADTAAAALLAYLTGKGGIALGRKLKPTKATP